MGNILVFLIDSNEIYPEMYLIKRLIICVKSTLNTRKEIKGGITELSRPGFSKFES